MEAQTMKLLDSAEVDKIREAWDWQIIDGVTTNPVFLKDWAKVPKA
jgi:transaldolase